jgi:nucleotidyltransferase/DNA polymerase involved in DNA repair
MPRWSSATIQSYGQTCCRRRIARARLVAAASYEAREFGVHAAMPSATAKRKCPDLIFVKPRFDVYNAVSLQIRAIFAEYTPIIEPLSLDKAYLDVTENLKGIVSATQIAETIRAKICTETGLTAHPPSPDPENSCKACSSLDGASERTARKIPLALLGETGWHAKNRWHAQ